MLNLEQIALIVKDKCIRLKDALEKKTHPQFNPIYYKSVKQSDKIGIHAELGNFPEMLFTKRAPNQTQDEYEYIKANFKTVTFPVWSRYISNLGRIWNDNNWSITWPEGATEAKEYLDSDYPDFYSFESYFRNIVSVTKERDPNAIICIKPYALPIVQDADGNLVVDETERINPVAVIYGSESVVDFVTGNYALVLMDEKSIVQVNDKSVLEGLVFELYDTENIYKIIQKGPKDDYNFDILLYYNHGLGYLPADKLKGLPKIVKDKVYYESFFLPAVDLLDRVLLDDSNLTAIKAAHAYPHKWEYVDECDFRDQDGNICIDGTVFKNGHQIQCPKCKGTGTTKPGVLGVHQIMMPTKTDDTTKGVQLPPFGWEAPNTEIMTFLRDEIKSNINNALSILGLTSTTDAQGSDTALGKMVDREELFSTLLMISNQVFSLYEFCIQAIIDMRYQDSSLYPVIAYPQTFAVRTEAELTAELNSAKQTGLPEIAYRKLLEEYLNRRFSNSELSQKAVNLAFYADRIIMLTSLEVAQKKLSGSVANWEDILHTSIYQFMQEAYNNDAMFFDKSIQDQANIVIQMAKAKDLEINPGNTNEQILNRLGNA